MDFELSEELCFSEFNGMLLIQEVLCNQDEERPRPQDEQTGPEDEKQDIANDGYHVVPEEFTSEDTDVKLIHTQEEFTPTYHPCPACRKVFKTAACLDKHIDRRHQEETFQKLPNESSQKNLIYFACEVCGKLLKSKNAWTCHMAAHKGNYSFLCHICGKGFTHQGSFKEHLLIHTKEKRHICTLCLKGFTQKAHLTAHLKSVHNDERPHVCHACEKKFSLKGNLSQHLRQHSSEVPRYPCKTCNKAFHYRSQLKKHEKVHMDANG